MDLKKFYLSEPWPISKLYHVFSKKGNRSLCGKFGDISPSTRQDLRGNEVWFKGQDCKACFKKAGFDVSGKERLNES